MSLANLHILRSTSGRLLPIPQLIKIIQPSCCLLVLNEVVNILVNRERDVILKSERLISERRLARERANLLDSSIARRQGEELKLLKECEGMIDWLTAEQKKALEKCKQIAKILHKKTVTILELEKSTDEMNGRNLELKGQGKCKELIETIELLTEELRASGNREKNAMEQYDETAKSLRNKTILIPMLNQKLDEMNDKNLESHGKCKELEAMIERLTEEKRASSDRETKAIGQCKKIVEELKHSQRKCKKLEEKIERLIEEQKKANEQYKDTDKILNDLSNLVLNSNKKFDDVKDESLKSQGKCKELVQMQMVERLTEEKLALSDRIKNVIGECEETDNILREKNTLILNLNKELEELKSKNLDSQGKCKYLEDINETLTKEQMASNDRERKAIKVLDEKTNLVLHLNNSLDEMKAKKSVSQRLLQESQEKVCQLEANVMKMKQEIVDLRFEKSMHKESYMQSDKVIQELKSKVYEATQTESKLRLKVLESEKDAQVWKNKLEHMEKRLVRMEEILTKCSSVNFEGFGQEGRRVAGDSFEAKVGAEKIFEDSPGAQSVYPPHLESKQTIHDSRQKEPQGSNQSKMTPFSADIEVIEIDDNEDEMKPVEADKVCSTSHNSRRKDQMMTVKPSPESPSPSPRQTTQGNSAYYLKDDNIQKCIWRGKRKAGDISLESTPVSKENTDGAPWTCENAPHKFHEAERTGEARTVRWKSMDEVMKALGELKNLFGCHKYLLCALTFLYRIQAKLTS